MEEIDSTMTAQMEQDSPVDIKGRVVSLTVVEVHTADLEELDRDLLEKTAQAPKFFRNAPVILDVEQLEQEVDGAWLDKAYGVLISNNFIPVGITGAGESLEYAARARNTVVWPAARGNRQEHEPDPPQPEPTVEIQPEPAAEMVEEEQPKPPPENGAGPAAGVETLVIKQPVRSGQKVYARGGDLIVLASVSTGAEILADGHIHVYGTLRGRAFAGAQGNEEARLFCNDLQADLVSIAGCYMINEDLPADKRNRAVHISLEGDDLKIESLR